MTPDRRDILGWAAGLLSQSIPAAPPRGPRPLSAARIYAVDRQARAQFHYRQPSLYPVRDYSIEAAARRPWEGNCTNLAVTAVALAKGAGAPPGTTYLALVLDFVRHGQHAVGVVQDDQGRRWVVGDTFAQAYPLPSMRHKLVRLYRYA